MTEGQLRAAISAHLQNIWLNQDPGPHCFDHNEERMDEAIRFMKGETADAESARVRDHIVNCSRCRYIYSKMWEVTLP
jgi:hypothetical protein